MRRELVKGGPARLTWSLAPHSPAERFATRGQLSVFSLATIRRQRQGLHLSRTMLDDQWSPYVGRFACDWHRLPRERLSGNHRPGLEPSASVATGRQRAAERPGHRDHTNLTRSCLQKCPRTLARGGSCGENVVDQDHAKRHGRDRREGSVKRSPPICSGPSGLRRRLDPSVQQSTRSAPRTCSEFPGQHLGLVVAAFTSAPPPERNPGDHDVGVGPAKRAGPPDRRRSSEGLEHPRGDGFGERTHLSELETHEDRPDRSLVQEGGPRPSKVATRTIATPRNRGLEWAAAPSASGRRENRDRLPTGWAKGPSTPAAPHAELGIEDIDDRSQHRRTIRTRTDTTRGDRYDSGTGIASDDSPEPSLISARSDVHDRKTG